MRRPVSSRWNLQAQKARKFHKSLMKKQCIQNVHYDLQEFLPFYRTPEFWSSVPQLKDIALDDIWFQQDGGICHLFLVVFSLVTGIIRDAFAI